MRIGYSCWGFLGPGVVDTPDGSRAYRRALIDGLIERGHPVVFLQTNRDLSEAGLDLRDRYRFDPGFPELDVLMLEWRWPLPGRNTTPCGTPGHTGDLHRQSALVECYTWARGTPTVIWDLDRRLPADDALRSLPNVRVCEFARLPTPGATTLLCPVPDRLLDVADPVALAMARRPVSLVYVGNQYDRDVAFDRYFAPAAEQVTHRVAGKWPTTARWPHVVFTGRCAFDEVAQIHRQALATVLLLPHRYAQVGHMTSRLFEAVLAGCVPLVPAEVVGADAFVPPALHVADATEVVGRVKHLRDIAGSAEHANLIAACLNRLQPLRLSHQLSVLDGVFTALTTRR